MDRDQFLALVRGAARAGQKYRVETHERSRDEGYSKIDGDVLDRLALEVNAVGGQARRVADLETARAALSELLTRYAAKSALVWQHWLLDELRLGDLLDERGVKYCGYEQLAGLSPAERRQIMLVGEIGISSADYAIAESGTLALLSRPGQERVVSLLPGVHVAIVRRDQVLPDLIDLFEKLQHKEGPRDEGGRFADASGGRPAELPSNLVLITGPSKTGDIELRLTTGVHGPRDWHVIVIG